MKPATSDMPNYEKTAFIGKNYKRKFYIKIYKNKFFGLQFSISYLKFPDHRS